MKIIYRDVYIPMSCDVVIPQKPSINENASLTNVAILNYARRLEEALLYCVGKNGL